METNLIKNDLEFIAINNKSFAEYYFIYRYNNEGSINDFSHFTSKNQLQFDKIENKYQELNLIFVDSLFVHILSDLTLSVLLNKTSCFKEYILSDDKINVVEEAIAYDFFNYKFFYFIHLLLYSNISLPEVFYGNIFTDRVFCLKNQFGEIEYFSIYDQTHLQLRLIDEMKITIDYNLSNITNHEVRLCLKIYSSFTSRREE